MKQPLLLILLLISFCSTQAFSQSKRANVWYFGKNGLDFNQSPPKLLKDGASFEPGFNTAAMADEKGNLLFYSEGKTIWNKNHQVMANGENLAGHLVATQGVLALPKPGSKTLYYVFTAEGLENKVRSGLHYSLVDMSKQAGLGEVVSKNVLVQDLVSQNLALTGHCNCRNGDKYWLAVFKQDIPRYIYTFLIDKDGISAKPVISLIPGISNNTYLKFSPDGSKIAFLGNAANGQYLTGIADFDFKTGLISGVNYIPPNSGNTINPGFYYSLEFSGSGRYLYLGSDHLVQYDIRQPTIEKIAASAKPFISPAKKVFSGMQLAPDGKIYINTQTILNPPNSYSTIEKPDFPGEASTLLIDKIKDHAGTGGPLPNFVSTFFYRSDTLSLSANAGPDQQICSTAPVTLGGKLSKSLTYRWSPATFLDDTSSANPTFRFSGTLTAPKNFEYVLQAREGACFRQDTVRVTVHPLPWSPIVGSPSVCPGVTGVVYQAAARPGHTYRWRVSGGTIAGGQGTSAIAVNWGETNPDAWVELIEGNAVGCEGPPSRLPVRINVKLETQTPQGLRQVCLNLRDNNPYEVIHTTGSVYTWGLQGGTLVSGQGTSKVVVNWQTAPPHKIWLQEQSTTRDTVCFGTSDTLQVTIFQDQTTLGLQNVSASLTEDKQVDLTWSSSDPSRLQSPITWWHRPSGTATWAEAGTHAALGAVLTDTGIAPAENSYEYQVRGLNGCGEPLVSPVHRTMQLQAQVREGEGSIGLNWNAYLGWPAGVERYEIWRQLDEQQEMKLVGQVDGATLAYANLPTTAGFVHRYRVKAIARGSTFTSWSNAVTQSFSHELSPPNILTPNGDGQNDVFVIRLLELYPDNQLSIYNRWGQQVMHTEGYQNNWGAANLAGGTYFYKLLLRKTGKQLTGWVEVVR